MPQTIPLEERVKNLLAKYDGRISYSEAKPLLQELTRTKKVGYVGIAKAIGRRKSTVSGWYYGKGHRGSRILTIPREGIEAILKFVDWPERLPREEATPFIECYFHVTGRKRRDVAREINSILGISIHTIEGYIFQNHRPKTVPAKVVDFFREGLKAYEITTPEAAKERISSTEPARVSLAETRYLFDLYVSFMEISRSSVFREFEKFGLKSTSLKTLFSGPFNYLPQRTIPQNVRDYLVNKLFYENTEDLTRKNLLRRLVATRQQFGEYLKHSDLEKDVVLGELREDYIISNCLIPEDIVIFLENYLRYKKPKSRSRFTYNPQNPEAYKPGDRAYFPSKRDSGRVIQIEEYEQYNAATFELLGTGKQVKFLTGKS